ncbi:MAG: putative Ig domain-containing protein [bacterium]
MKKITFSLLAFLFLAFAINARASISSPNINNWVGTGSNESAFVLQWNDGKSPGAIAWGYRWNPGAAPTLNQLIANLLAANAGIYARGDSSGSYGAGYYGFGYDTGLNNTFSVNGGLDADGNPTTISFTNGFSDMNSDNTTYQSPGSSTSAAPTNSQDRYQEGWNDNGFWELYTSTSTINPTSWSTSWDGGEQSLTADSWYAYTFSNSDFSSNPPVLPTPSPRPSPSITSATITGSVGSPLTASITASNSPTGYAVNPGSLPSGLTLNPTTGAISGTPTSAGNGTIVSVSATNSGGAGTGYLTFNIAKGNQTISGVPTTLSKTLGTLPYSLNASTNSNLSMTYSSSNTGVATVSANGIVSLLGIGSTTLTVSQNGNANYKAATNVTQSLTVSGNAPLVTSATINGTVDIALSSNITATNSPTSYLVASGTMPSGLSINATTGLISGIPKAFANGTIVVVKATNVSGNGTANLTFNIARGSQTITGVASTMSKAAGSYSLNASVTSNLTLSYASSNTSVATVATNGTVAIVGNGSTTLTVSQSGSANYNAATNVTQALTVSPAPTITSNATATATRGTPFAYQITASNSPTSYSITGNLTQGLSLNGTTGLISGTPTASGNASILLYATNAYGNGTKTLTISVANLLPAVTSNNSTTATLGVPFNYQITATNAPLTGYAVIGTLPTGLALSTTSGLISGTPTASGNFLLNLIAKNSAGNSTAAPLSITIAPAVTFSISGPINQKVVSGSNATFSVSNAVASTANATLSYQWYKNGLAIGNATASSYTIPTLDYATAGAYSVKVTTKVGTTTIGSVTSEVWSITPSDALSILVYTLTGNATRTAGAVESSGTISGYFVMDRANNNAAIIQTYGSGLLARNSLETRNDIAAYSTGPVTGSRTVFAGSLNSGNSTTDHDLVWITGKDSAVTVATGKTVFAPSTMSGIIGTIAQSSAVEIDSFSIALILNNSLTANASSSNLTSTITAVRKAASDAGYPNETE